MKIKQDLFGAIGLNEHAPIKSLLIVIIFLASIGIFADGIVDIIEQHIFTKFFIALVMFLIVFYIGYYYLGQQELKIVKELSSDKEIMILVTPSNVNHLYLLPNSSLPKLCLGVVKYCVINHKFLIIKSGYS